LEIHLYRMKIFFRLSIVFVLFVVGLVLYAGTSVRSTTSSLLLHFKQGDLHHLAIQEVLRITMHFPQVDFDDLRPSVRTTDYDFTEHIDTVYADGSALFAVTLDSFKTAIVIGEGRSKEQYFTFNTNDDYDLQHNFHDIRALPRAQFLGQTLRFTVGTDGLIRNFQNLANFHRNTLGEGYDYDFTHAMLSLTDSLRVGQLLEPGFGAIAAATNKPEGSGFTSAYTATEIPIKRTVLPISVKHKGTEDSITIRATYSDAPARIDYLEGLAATLGLTEYKGSGSGYAVVANGTVVRAMYRDTSNSKLQVDIEAVPEEIIRQVKSVRTPVAVIRGGNVSVKEIKEHRGIYKEPKIEPDSDATVLDQNGQIIRPPLHDNH
jgi:hypothetical protein